MIRTALASASLAILLTATAVAAPKQKKPMVDMDSVPVPARPAPEPKTAETSSPTMTLDEFTGRQRARIQKINDQQIIYLQNLIKLASPDDPNLPDYLFRLGELYAEKYRYWEGSARALDEDIFRAEHGEGSSLVEPRRKEQRRAQEQAEQALRAAAHLLVETSHHADYPRMDEVLYRLGYLLEAAGRKDGARAAFHRLLKEHPQSRHVPDAFLAFGDDAFAKGDMAQALDFYAKVTEFPQAQVFGFALYKKAWAQANLADFKGALASFVDLLARCQAGTIAAGQRGPLEKEARRDLVKVYARTPGADPDRALEFFRRVAGNEAPRMLQGLAELYWEQGMPGRSSRVYRRVIALDVQSPDTCTWQYKILRNTLAGAGESEQIQELRRLGNAYRYVQQLGGGKRSALDQCRNHYRDSARELAFVLHKQAQRTKQLSTYELAAAAYRALLDDFEATSVEAAFYYAECLWQVASLAPAGDEPWRQAAEQYTRVVRLDPKGPFVKEAALAAVLAWQNVVYQSDEDLKQRPTSVALTGV